MAGQHLNNVVIYVPYFFKGELLAFSMVRAHWIDVGGTSTGFGAGPEVPDPWQEGLQLDQLKIYEGGKINETLHRVIRDNIRFPESSLGDMNSQIGSSTKPKPSAATSSPGSPTASTKPNRFSTTMA